MHYLHEHDNVHWIGNQSGSYDIEVRCANDRNVLVEITSKKDDATRLTDNDLVLYQIRQTLLEKFVQVRNRFRKGVDPAAIVIIIYFPEELDWDKTSLTDRIDDLVKDLLLDTDNAIIATNLSGIILVSPRCAQKVNIDGRECWNLDDSAYHIPNPISEKKYPIDFSPHIKLRPGGE